MKRTKIIMAFLLCACLIVGVGYATLADELIADATGSFEQTIPEFDAKVKFLNVTHIGNGINAPKIDEDNADRFEFSVAFIGADDTTYESAPGGVFTTHVDVTFTYDAETATAPIDSAAFAAPVLSDGSEIGWTVTSKYVRQDGTITDTTTLLPGEVATLRITVEYNPNTPNAEANTEFTVNLPVTGVDVDA